LWNVAEFLSINWEHSALELTSQFLNPERPGKKKTDFKGKAKRKKQCHELISGWN